MATETEQSGGASGGDGQDIDLKLILEDDGREFDLHAGPGTPMATMIERVYEKVGRGREPDDRLRCEGTGEDVFAFSAEKLGEYLDQGHCPCRTWVFVGPTGGA